MKKYILLLLSIILLIVSCQKNPTAEQIFNKYMEIVQSGEYDRIKKIDSSVRKDIIRIAGQGLKKITYKINDVKVKGKITVINVTIRIPNFGKYTDEFNEKFDKKYMNSNINETEIGDIITEELYQFFNKKLENGNMDYTEETINVKFQKRNNKWFLDINENPEFISLINLKIDRQN